MSPERFTMPVAVHVFLVRDGDVLLLRRCNTGYEDGNYSVPAGHLEAGEHVLETAIREAHEEAGISFAAENSGVVGVMHRKSNDERIDFFVAISEWSGDVRNAEPTKCADLRWFPLDRLPENTIPYIRRAIANYREGRWFDTFGWEEPS